MSTVIRVTLPSSGFAFEQDVNEMADNVIANNRKIPIKRFFIVVISFH
jgi:hypothetical protein